jgi:diaminopimelate decarboxylase
MFKVGADKSEENELHPYEIAGPLCTSIDRIARNVKLPSLNADDVIAIERSGAYGLTSSPVHFISHELPKEIMAETINGKLKVDDISEQPR